MYKGMKNVNKNTNGITNFNLDSISIIFNLNIKSKIKAINRIVNIR